MAQERLQQLAVGTGLYQIDRLGVARELALDRDVAPRAQRRRTLDPLQQVGRTTQLVITQRGLMDVVIARPHRLKGEAVVRFRDAPLQAFHRPLLSLQLLQQHRLMLVPLLVQQLIELGGSGALLRKQLLVLQLFPPGADHRAAAEQGQLGGGDQSVGHGEQGFGGVVVGVVAPRLLIQLAYP